MFSKKLLCKLLSITTLAAAISSVGVPDNTFAATSSESMPMAIEEAEEYYPVGGWEPLEIEYVDDEYIEPEVKSYRRVINSSIDDVFSKGAGKVGYESLTSDAQRSFYANINKVAEEFMNSTTDLAPKNGKYIVGQPIYSTLGLTEDEAINVYQAYDYDHPAYYWISNTIGWSSIYINMYTEEEYASVATRETINDQIRKGVKEYAAIAEKAEDNLDKIAVIHDLIVNDVDYAYKNGDPETAKWAHSVHGMFDPNHKSVVCEGYADTFSLMMNYMGIPNYYIVGKAGSGGAGGGGGHAWNAVYDDSIGKYIYMDLTWDDCGEDGSYYKYFGMPKSDFEQTHFKGSPTNKGLWLYDLTGDFADSFEETYYYRGGFYCNTTDYEGFAKKGNTKIHRFGTMVSYLIDLDRLMDFFGVKAAIEDNSNSYISANYEGKKYAVIIKDMTEDVDLSSSEVTLVGDTFAYTGRAIEPGVKEVICNGIKLIDDNYTVSYEDNTVAGNNTAKAVVTGNKRFTGTAKTSFSISGEALSDSMVTLSATDLEYSGTSQKPEVTVKKDGTTLVNDKDYTVTYSEDTINVGTVEVTVTGKGGYTGTVVKTYKISPASISGYIVNLEGDTGLVYDGSQKIPSVASVKKSAASKALEVKDYDVAYENNVDAGTATVKVTGKGNYKGTAAKSFSIGKADISNTEMVLSKTTYEYPADQTYEPSATLTYKGVKLIAGTDYNLTYADNTAPGNAKAKATGKGNYTGTKEAVFSIVEKRSIENADIALEYESIAYDGSSKKPSVTISYGNDKLIAGTDFEVKYENDTVNAGTKNVTITGIGSTYVGTKNVSYKIALADISAATIELKDTTLVYSGREIKPAVTVTKSGKALVEGTDYKLSYADNFNAGTNSAKVIAEGNGNYSGKATKAFSIEALAIAADDVSQASNTIKYDGTAKQPVVTVKKSGLLLDPDRDYEVTYSNNIDAGNSANYTVSGKGNYKGTVNKSFTITQADGSISYAVGNVSKKLTDDEFTNQLTNTGDGAVTYTSDKPGVAVVDNSTGKVSIVGAGTAVITATVQNGANYSYAVKNASYTLTVNKVAALITKAPEAIASLVYNGSEQALVTAGTTSHGKIWYSLAANGTFTETVPVGVNAGTYSVYYKVKGDGNHNDSAVLGPVNVTIAKANAIAAIKPKAKTLTYTGAEQALVTAGSTSEGKMKYSLEEEGTYSESIPCGVNAGTYTVYYKVAGDGNHNDSAVLGSVEVSIGKVVAKVTKAPTAKGLTYTGAGQELISAGTALGGEFGYSTDNVNFSKDIPKEANAGTYTVYYRVEGDVNHTNSETDSIEVVIIPAQPVIEKAPIAKSAITYNGEELELVDPGSAAGCTMYYSLSKDGEFTTSIPKGRDANEYIVYYYAKGMGNYGLSAVKTVKATIAKAESSATASPSAITDLVYTGSEQELITAGSTSDGKMKYSLEEEGTYSESIPCGVNAGVYTVYYKVAGDENHNDSAALGSVEVSIGKATYIPKISIGEWCEGEAAVDPIVENNFEDGLVTYAYKVKDSADDEYSAEVPESAGEYTLKAAVEETDNYKAVSETVDFTILKARATVVEAPVGYELTYTGEAQSLNSMGKASGGTMLYSLDNSEWSEEIPKAIETGNYKVSYMVKGDAEHSDSLVKYVNASIVEAATEPSEPQGNNSNENNPAEEQKVTEPTETSEKTEEAESTETSEKLEEAESTETSEKTEETAPTETSEKSEETAPTETSEKSEETEKTEKTETPEKTDESDAIDVPETPTDSKSEETDAPSANEVVKEKKADSEVFSSVIVADGHEIVYPTTISYSGISRKKTIQTMLTINLNGELKTVKKIRVKKAKNVGTAIITKVTLTDGTKLKGLSIPIQIVKYTVRTEDIVSAVTDKKIKVAIPGGKTIKVNKRDVSIDEAKRLITFNSKNLTGTCSY
ncbi:MAG: hypothetical protein K6G84_01640 [Lachnospiraceae bacterium]|nr:hypothetical protein [Lachnospiraceae bacterium]